MSDQVEISENRREVMILLHLSVDTSLTLEEIGALRIIELSHKWDALHPVSVYTEKYSTIDECTQDLYGISRNELIEARNQYIRDGFSVFDDMEKTLEWWQSIRHRRDLIGQLPRYLAANSERL